MVEVGVFIEWNITEHKRRQKRQPKDLSVKHASNML